jgi:hypothetical protein
MTQARCATTNDPDIFFEKPTTARKAFCEGCPVRVACREYSIAEGLLGTWGDEEPERRRLAERRGQILISPTFDTYLSRRGR